MDQDSPVSRVERTLWTVWSYISEAVNRFFKPQPADPVSSHPNSPNGSEAGGKPPDWGLTQDNAIDPSEEEDEQRPDATVSLLSLSSATGAWKVCANDSKYDEGQGNENKTSEDGRSREEDFDQVGNDHPGLLDAEPTGNQVQQTEIKHSYACEQSGASKSDQKHANAGSVTDGTVSKRIETSDEEPGADEKSKMRDDHQIGNEAMAETQPPEDVEEDLEDEEQVCTTTDEENSEPEEGVDTDDAAPMLNMKNANICEGVRSENANSSEERRTQVENQPWVCDVSQNKQVVSEQETGGEYDERMPAAAATEEEDIREAARRQTEDEEPETETIQDGQQEEVILTQCLTRSDNAEQKTQQELTGAEEDVLVTIMQTTETEATIISFLDKDQVKEWPTGEADDKESCVENACTSVTVKLEAAQEVGREFKNILQPIAEGQAAELHKLNTDVSGETREGVPEHNNELEADENKTQRFWEGGNGGEIHVAPLPEEVEAGEQASLKNNGMGAGYLLETGILEVAEDSKFDLTEELTEHQRLAQDAEEPQTGQENLESEFLFEEEDVELLENPMKVQFKLLDKELETNVETDNKTTEELQDGVKAPADAKEDAGDDEERKEDAAADEGAEFAEEPPYYIEAGVKTSTETSLSLKSVQYTHTNQKSEGASSSPEEKNTSVVLQQIEMKLSGDSSKDILHVGLEPNEKDSTDEEETDDKTQDVNEIPPLQLETTGELVEMQKDAENTPTTESGSCLHPERWETTSQSPLRARRMQEVNTTTNTEAADGPDTTGATDCPETSAEDTEETSRLIADHQDVIDEEILDLWIEAATSKDIDVVEDEDGFEIQNDTTEHPSGEILESEKELLMEPHSVEPTSSDTEMLSTLEPELLDQTQPRPTESLEDLPNMVAADLSDLSALDSESRAALMEETAEPVEFSLREEDPSRGIESCSASGVSASEEKHLHGESEQSEEPDMGTGTTVWRNTEEADVTSLIDIDVHFQAETRVEDESVNDVLFEKESVLMEHPSGDEHWIEAEKYQMSLDHRSSGDFTESLQELGRAEVAEEQEIAFEDRDEVDALLLDSTIQRSRISVKNPRVRPPTDPRSLIHMPSEEPTPHSHVPVKVPPGVPLGGLGVGIKLPGLGVGFPVLKKTQRSREGEDGQNLQSQEIEKKAEEKSEEAKQDETQHKPKWMPPGAHAGFGNPLLSELRTKLKKTAQE